MLSAKPPGRADPLDWRHSRDIETSPDIWCPRYFRCTDPRCLRLVTHGFVALGGCACGNPRLIAAGRLTWWECVGLKMGRYALTAVEGTLIRPWNWKGLYAWFEALVYQRPYYYPSDTPAERD